MKTRPSRSHEPDLGIKGSWRRRAAATGPLLPLAIAGPILLAAFTAPGADTHNPAAQKAPGGASFVLTAGLNTPRYHHTATLLNNGMVLIAGGFNRAVPGSCPPQAELYDPAAGTVANAGSLITPRYHHTATLLKNGKVLIAGGLAANGTLASAELYDPATRTFTATGRLSTGRAFHTSTLLNDGQVLITGGSNSGRGTPTYLATAELYNPATRTFSDAGGLGAARVSHTATRLQNGMVLIVGGDGTGKVDLGSAELFDPATGTFSPAGNLNTGRVSHTATLLNNWSVHITGGTHDIDDPTGSAELYNPTKEQSN